MKWSVRGACAALSACLLLACALGAAAVGLRCFSLGSELRGEPFRLGAAAGAFYSGLLLAAGLALLGAALLCRAPRAAPPAGPGPGPGPGLGAPEAAAGGPGGAAAGRARGQNLLLLGALVFMLGVLSAFAGAVIDGDTVALAERKYSHHCLPAPARATSAQCRRLKDYQRGLLLSAVFNALECLLGLLSLLLAKSYRAARARRGRRRGARGRARLRGPPPGVRARRGRRGRRGGRLQPRPSEACILAPEESDAAAPGDCAGLAARLAVACISVGGPGARDAAGAEVSCAGHPSLELPGYAPSDPDLDASYPYCCRPPRAAARPWALGPAR